MKKPMWQREIEDLADDGRFLGAVGAITRRLVTMSGRSDRLATRLKELEKREDLRDKRLRADMAQLRRQVEALRKS